MSKGIGTVVLWQSESLLAWVDACEPERRPDVGALVASLWESVCEAIPSRSGITRHRAFGDWSRDPGIGALLVQLGAELVHLPDGGVGDANLAMALDMMELVGAVEPPERIVVAGCDQSALGLLRTVWRCGIPVAPIAVGVPALAEPAWSFGAGSPVFLEYQDAARSAEEDETADAGVCDVTEELEEERDEGESPAPQPAPQPARVSRFRHVVTDRAPLHIEPFPKEQKKLADLTNPTLVMRLKQGLTPGKGWRETVESANHPDSVKKVREWLQRMPAHRVSGASDPAITRGLEVLSEIAKSVASLKFLRRSTHHAVLSWAVHRLRALQEAAGKESEATSRQFAAIMGAFTAHSWAERPGSVRGMALKHLPQKESWHADACASEARLRVELDGKTATPAVGTAWNRDNAIRELFELVRTEPEVDATAVLSKVRELIDHGVPPNDRRLVHALQDFEHLLGGHEFAKVLSAVREEREAREAASAEAAEPESRRVPADWPGFAHTRGRRAVIIGGDERPEARERLQLEFGFEELVWLPTSQGAGVTRAHALVERMGSGTVDLVVILQGLVGHWVTDMMFRAETDRARVALSATYGVNQVRAAVDRYLLGVRPS